MEVPDPPAVNPMVGELKDTVRPTGEDAAERLTRPTKPTLRSVMVEFPEEPDGIVNIAGSAERLKSSVTLRLTLREWIRRLPVPVTVTV